MSRNLGSLCVAAVLVLLVTACGGEKASAPNAATASASATASTGGTAPASGGGAPVASRFCGDWGTLAGQTAKLSAPSASSGGVKESVDATNGYMKALADTAPSEIKGDFQVFAKFWSDYSAVLAKANYDISKMATDPDLQKAMQAMSDPKLQQASTNIAAWVQKNCIGR